MGWKTASLIISNVTTVDAEKLLQELGIEQFKKTGDEPYDVAIYPKEQQIFVGIYHQHLVISSWQITELSFSKELSKYEQVLTALFPASEICTMQLHSGVNHWGYALIKNGEKIRVRCGNADEGTIIDFGEPLQEELALLSKSKLEGEKRMYYLDGKEPYEECQVGENFVAEIYKRYTGVNLFEDDGIFEFNLMGFETPKPGSVKKPLSTSTLTTKKPWWKIW
ncbi:DUF6928 family protein [Chitinophaga silvisoli]|uniref:Uncharacterized protein n=1 Tax=Chitinophaga silvisoli TaxID=2291814 RepID=A0A3E1P3Q9_9BACT|nr:hypothetical protein [Chitinophaga silvisoli]RFM34638.1 hypothetical protein DXN04_15345 [Chitinophaga silvisoli]